MPDLSGKTVLITGTSRGLGRAFVKLFAKAGANVIAHARTRSDEHEAFIKQLSYDCGVTVSSVYFDLTDLESMKGFTRELIKNRQPIDIIINNAGVAHGGLFQMTSMDKIREVFEINLFSHMQLTQLLLRYMIKRGHGSIVNIASIAGIDLNEGNCAYGLSKAALIAFTKTLAAETAPFNIRVNAVAPGLSDTDMANLMEEKAGRAMIEHSAMKRLGKPQEIAEAVLFLASDEASFINGQVLRVDGGRI